MTLADILDTVEGGLTEDGRTDGHYIVRLFGNGLAAEEAPDLISLTAELTPFEDGNCLYSIGTDFTIVFEMTEGKLNAINVFGNSISYTVAPAAY